VVTTLGSKVRPGIDAVSCDGERVIPEVMQAYVLLNKPRGVVTSRSDPQRRPVVLDLLPRRGLPRLFPVGRLDVQTEGLLLLTNDGTVAHALTHPRFGVDKEYLVKVQGCPTLGALARLKAGVASRGERLRAEEAQLVTPGVASSWLRVIVREGRYHEIRRMCEAIGHPVVKLRRVRIGPIRLGRLPRGGWRRLTPREIASLRRLVRITDA
jgi:pseudouridine synthase